MPKSKISCVSDAIKREKMDLIEDSLMNDSDWLSDHTIGLENTLWDSLSDKGNFQIFYCLTFG